MTNGLTTTKPSSAIGRAYLGRGDGVWRIVVTNSASLAGFCSTFHPRMVKKLIFASEEGGYPTESSCRFPLIVLQQTTQSFFATHNSVVPARPSIRQGEQQPVLLALVIALLVVMGHVLLH